MNCVKKYVWVLLMGLMPMGFVSCSDSDEPVREPEVINPNRSLEYKPIIF